MPAKFDRCVKGVKRRSKGRVNAYAVCTAAGTRRGNPSKVRIIHDYGPRLGVFNGKVYLIDENSETINGIPLKIQGTHGDHEVAYSSQLEWDRAYASKVGDTTIIQVPWAGGRKEFAVYNTDRYQKLEDKEQPKAKVVKPKKADTYKGFFIAKDSHGYLAADEQRNLVRGEETFTGSTKGSIHKQVDNWLELQEEIKRGHNPGYGRHLEDDYSHLTLYKYFSTKQAAKSYLRLNSWPGGVESKRGGWPGARDWVAGEEFRVKVPDGGTRLIGQRGNPKSPDDMTAGELNKALDKVDAKLSALTQKFIDAGRGNERPSDWRDKTDPLSLEYKRLHSERSPLYIERDMRYGPGAPSRLPTGRGFGPRRKSNPESGAESMYESFHGAPSEEVLEFQEQEHYHGNLAGLGVLVELKLVTLTGYDVTLTFSNPETLIAANNPRDAFTYKTAPVWFKKWALENYDWDDQELYDMQRSRSTGSKDWHKAFSQKYGREPQSQLEEHIGEMLFKNHELGSRGQLSARGQEYAKQIKADNPSVWDRLKSIGSSSTVYHMPKHTAKMTKAGTFKGHEIFKTQEGDFRVPSLERESSFDTLADAKKFVGAWKGNGRKKNKGPFQSASKLIGSTGKYLDDQLGRVLNPSIYDYEDATRAGTQRAKELGVGPKALSKATVESEFDIWWKYGGSEQSQPSDKAGNKRAYVRGFMGTGRKSNPVSLDPALLCSNEDGTQLYIQGGDQSVDLKSIHMADVPVKDSMVLGEAYFVSYFTEKDFDNHQPTIYEHDLGEESDPPKPKYRKDEVHTAANRPGLGQGSGCYPTVRYDTLNQRVYLDGGDYKIEKPMMGTSPGLEN